MRKRIPLLLLLLFFMRDDNVWIDLIRIHLREYYVWLYFWKYISRLEIEAKGQTQSRA